LKIPLLEQKPTMNWQEKAFDLVIKIIDMQQDAMQSSLQGGSRRMNSMDDRFDQTDKARHKTDHVVQDHETRLTGLETDQKARIWGKRMLIGALVTSGMAGVGGLGGIIYLLMAK